MLEFLSKELSEQLRAAQQNRQRRKSRLRVRVDQAEYPVLRLWVDGMALQVDGLAHLRGLVDIYDGSRHLLQCLIVASELDGNELVCSFKRATAVSEKAALDYWRDESAPIAYLPKA